ncbi:NifU family protein [Magnetospirillum fulvum]|uniref:Fe-S cluster biogenesis protein NfuA, 4Fe-4S-binding domain n=1 Tax=Magnetospirillum fulvum TaxID=1082 RepID=A0A1H6H0B5_MAGFU|nr:NifU family protein [Magnetospirillum fulvum]SEH27698.1 Fe-S cluster biogenesis protein NfuA, 4Fe-4S-binding domain [Magnetospirillum fulvum]
MFIQTEPTPNPSTLKFLPGTDVMPSGTADFDSAESAASSPLATRLFAIDGVAGVFLAADFISVAKADEAEWQVIKPQVLAAIMEHFASGQPVIEGAADAAEAGEDDALVAQIKELIETRVRPAVAQDGGDITFRGFRDGIVYLRLQGACSGCPSASATLKHGIENMLKYYVPEVQAVQAVA